jgi:regulator of protease activity HflC (stomatin/prohibitin superfamily)
MTVEATAQVRMQIRDYLRFLKNIGSISSAMKQLRDTAEGVLKLEFASRTPALIPAHWGAINTAFEAKINAIVVSWGVDVHGAQLIDVDLTKTVNKGLRDALNSSLLKEAIIKTAEAEKEKRILEGQGDASAQLSLLTAQAEGKAKLAAIAKTKGGRYAMALETASKTVESADYSIVGTDGISGAIAAAMETMKKVHSPDKPAKAKKGG